MPLQRMLYISTPTRVGRDDLDQILEVSRRNNGRDAVTGMLLFTHSHFVQMLEGRRHAVSAAFRRILQDNRHTNVEIVSLVEIDVRLTAEWGMAYMPHTEETLARYRPYYPGHGFEPDAMRPKALEALCREMLRNVSEGSSDDVRAA